MRADGLRGRHQRRFKATTDSRHPLPVAENRLARDVGPSAPNPVWTLEIASLWTDEGWLDLASALDRFNCEVVGWSLRPRLTTDLVTDALTMAWFRRRPAPGAMQHSDRGSRSAGHAFREQPTESGMVCSMSRNGNCRDHAPTESGFNSFKNARVFGERFSTREAMKATAFESIEVFDNRMRRHSSPGFTSPLRFLKDWIKTQPHEQPVA